MKASPFLLILFVLIASTGKTQDITHAHCSKKSFYTNLAAEARLKSVLSDQYDVNYYKLDLHVERNSVFIEGNATIKALTTTPMDTFICELHDNHNVDSVFLNGQKKSFSHGSHRIMVPVGAILNPGNPVEVVVYYSGSAPQAASSAIGQGFSTDSSPTWGNEATWSLSQPFSAYEWFPVKQELLDKADSVEVWITTDTANMVGSQGLLQGITPMPNGKHRFEWKSNYAIAYYLISVAVAKYVDYTFYVQLPGMNDSMPVVNYIYDNPQTLSVFKAEIDKTADMLRVFSEKFGLYPFSEEKYGHCMAPFGGGMEHQTMTSQGFFSTDLTSHELAHQWFGDDITCASWADIALNEGFASYLEYVFYEEEEPGNTRSWLDYTHTSALQPTGSVFVSDTSQVSRIFSTNLTYRKGAFFLHMLRYEINDDPVFFNALKTYQNSYRGGNVNSTQFKQSMEQSTSMDLTTFFNQWYYGEGYPIFDIKWAQVNEKVYLEINQSTTSPFVIDKFETHLDLKIIRANGATADTTLRLFIDDFLNRFTIEDLKGEFVTVEVDPDQWILNDVSGITNDPILAVNEMNEGNEIEIYPNPFDSEFTLDIQDENEVLIQVFDLNGKLVLQTKSVGGGKQNLELAGVKSGTYFLHILSQNGMKEFKIVKK